ncbi:WXG100 family type VII secretion target [Actinomyces sp. B33]|uniref:WXG100 family type VII secretion target n=1 Tax=Actinomyces sp. B33 TaxID=2942131 RepID=UPI002340F25A|nr:WXG100 family type VII secretion target [Actinomyces sp. B33]MDC4232223.1 WXG100 family type VII secretion target [Actinomyces sp. B33]
MAMYMVDSDQVAVVAARTAATADRIRVEVQAMLAELLALQGSWTGAASLSFQECVSQWRATQVQVETALEAIGSQMGLAANAYAEAEARSVSLFAG